MKKLSETLKEPSFPIEIKDENGNLTYRHTSADYWEKWEYDANGKQTYYHNSADYWEKWEYDCNGNLTCKHNSAGIRATCAPRSTKTCEGKVVEVDSIKYKLTAL